MKFGGMFGVNIGTFLSKTSLDGLYYQKVRVPNRLRAIAVFLGKQAVALRSLKMEISLNLNRQNHLRQEELQR